MESFLILLNAKLPMAQKLRRRRRQVLIHFLNTLELYLQVGFDLGYAWPEALSELSRSGSHLHLLKELESGPNGVGKGLRRLSEEYPEMGHRLWFGVMRDLYQNGAGLADAVTGISLTLRQEHRRDLEAHFRTLPTRINVCLILFFLPSTLALLFIPLVIEIISNLN